MTGHTAWLTAVAIALAESCCVGLWLAVLGHGISGEGAGLIGLPPLLLPLHALLAMTIPTLLLRRGWARGRRAIVLYAVAIGAIAASLAPALVDRLSRSSSMSSNLIITVAALALLWWRGAVLAGEELMYDAVLAEWCWCIAALVVALLIGAGSGALSGVVGPVLLLFSVSSLVALAGAWRRSLAGHLPISGSWSITLATVLLVFVVPALLGAVLLGPSFAASVGHALGALLDGLLLLLSPVLLVIGWLIAWAIELLRALQRLSGVKPRQPLAHPSTIRPPVHPIGHQVDLISALPWAIGAVIVIGLVAYLLIRRATYTRATPVRAAAILDEERETLLSWRDAWRALVSWLGALRRRRLIVPAHESTLDDGADLSDATLTVREVYRRLLSLGAAFGVTRTPVETPHEYLARLRRRFSEREKDVSLITASYVYTRYGPHPATPDQAEHARLAWDRVISIVPDAAEE